ncbi:hypothetical protein [Thioalkalivibrio sp. AKL6]|uniref:hypothetical protein n=1 Tax=Thioalkalivibrio sp. AKL6 TaxID=1158154 RepID=UPI0012DFBFA6|nr:hypothetical protein [Thioalkalivibrio sp. AKL6]
MIEAHSLNGIKKKLAADLPRTIVGLKREPVHEIGWMTSFESDGPTRYQKVRFEEQCDSKLVGILLAHPNAPTAQQEIVGHLSHFHLRSGEAVDFFCVGYGAFWPRSHYVDQAVVASIDGTDWYFSEVAFSEVIDEIERETKWSYSGETELILLSAHKGFDNKAELDFGSAIVCNLERMGADGAFTSVRAFFAQIFRFAKCKKARDPAWAFSDHAGVGVGKSVIKDGILGILPSALRQRYRQAEHYAVRDIGDL